MAKSDDPDVFSAALVIIGNEILAGRTQDTNTPWIAERLTAHGILLNEVRIIPDEEPEIIHAVRSLYPKYDYVFTTGGIGPTHDDITADCVAKAFDAQLVRNEEAFRMLEEHYGLEELTPPRAKMCMIPAGASLIPNPVTAAPGFIMENVHVMAGVPRIMQAMLDHVLGMIKAGKPILSNTVACSLPESAVAEDVTALQETYAEIQIGSYPHYRGGVLGLSLVLRGTDKDRLEAATAELLEIIRKHGDEPRALSIRTVDS
ncbi:MAG: competence/damage-inducible protein A [Rhodospirillales bacterium]|nr:competence/damage-inducible protein A [Rhodospirillales bacterium]MCB9995148.1 competence/damage-inducible protein A [Rhodospirillales bacterium]